MTQIIDISRSENWVEDIRKAAREFLQEYGIEPHLYCGVDFVYRSYELADKIGWWTLEKDSDNRGSGYFYGLYFEVRDDVQESTVILKG